MAGGILSNPEKVEDSDNLTTPNNKWELVSFLCMMQSNAEFILEFFKKAALLRKLIKKVAALNGRISTNLVSEIYCAHSKMMPLCVILIEVSKPLLLLTVIRHVWPQSRHKVKHSRILSLLHLSPEVQVPWNKTTNK